MSQMSVANKRNSNHKGSFAAFLFDQFQQKKLVAACLLIALFLFLANDTYKAKAMLKSNRELFSNKTVINYIEASNRWSLTNDATKKRLSNRNLLFANPFAERKTQKARRAKAFAGGDTCTAAPIITSFPYTDSGTTAGAADNYDLPAADTDPGSPTPPLSGCPTCNATGAPDGRGNVYEGTGTGPDVAYRINYNSASGNSLNVTATPAAGNDIALIVYTSVCSNSLADAIVIDDTNIPGEAESVSITNMPAGTYHIVVDTYTTGGELPAPGGAYTLNVTGTGTILAPTAAPVSVQGRVLTANGRGISKALISATDSNGKTRTALTNPFGYYKFDDLSAGDTFTFEVSHKLYKFSNPVQILSPGENVSEFNFISIK